MELSKVEKLEKIKKGLKDKSMRKEIQRKIDSLSRHNTIEK